MTMKRFIAIWDVLRHFKDVFGMTIWMLIPGVNQLIAAVYNMGKMTEMPSDLRSKIKDNFFEAQDPWIGVKERWQAFFAEVGLSSLYISIAYLVNYYLMTWVLSKISIDAWGYVVSIIDVQFMWLAFATWIVGMFFKTGFGMLHAIYVNWTTFHPDYAKQPLEEYFLRRRAEAIERRAQLAVVS